MTPDATTDLDLDLSDLRPARELPDLDWDTQEDTRPYSVPAFIAALTEEP